MQSNDENLVLITKYLNNPSDIANKQLVDELRSQSAEHESFFLEIERLWQLSSSAARLSEFDEKKSIQRFSKLLKMSTKSNKMLWLKGIAASLLVAMVSYWIYTANYKAVFLVKSTGKNQIDSVNLADGSVIILAENSQLRYPEKFSSSRREVQLFKGQAFFKITKDPKHPFKVDLNKSNVIVLGTSFNIKMSAAHIDVGVIIGKVMFQPYQDGPESILTAGQALSYDIEKKQLVGKTSQNANAWLTNELVFVDTPLEEVCEQLTTYYHQDIQFVTNKKVVQKLNATFKHQTLDQVLEVLSETFNMKITKNKDQIKLTTP